jgi:hypothetical protein
MFKNVTLGYMVFIKLFLVNRVITEYNKIINEKTKDFMDFVENTCENTFQNTFTKFFKKYKSEKEIWNRIFANKNISIIFKYYYYLYYTISVEYQEYEYEDIEKVLHKKTTYVEKQSLYDFIQTNYTSCTFEKYNLNEFITLYNKNPEFKKKVEDMHYKQETEKILKANIIYETIHNNSNYTPYYSYYYEYKLYKNKPYFVPENVNSNFIDLVDLSMNMPKSHTIIQSLNMRKTMDEYLNYLENHVQWLIDQSNNIC